MISLRVRSISAAQLSIPKFRCMVCLCTQYAPRTQRRSIAVHTNAHQAADISIIPSTVDTSTVEFKENAKQMTEVIGRFNDLHQKVMRGGSQSARDKHAARGKMLPREYVYVLASSHILKPQCVPAGYLLIAHSRITSLLDPGTSFLELSALAGHALYPGEDVPAGGIVTGVGTVEGVTCMVVANDSTWASSDHLRMEYAAYVILK